MSALRAGACLSLSGRFAPFGIQAERGLRLWADEFGVDLTIVDDRSDSGILEGNLPGLASQVDLLFGPYSTVLTRAATAFAQRRRTLLFNHGGSGARLNVPGNVVNILTPADQYAAPFVAHVARAGLGRLFTYCESGLFGQQVIAGAGRDARAAGVAVEGLDFGAPPDGQWDFLSAGVYEDDITTVRRALGLPNPPRRVCSVAAGVGSFADDVEDPDGVFGVGQWAPGVGGGVDAGMAEPELLAAWRDRFGSAPDYPGVQAYAAGVIAAIAMRSAGTVEPGRLWQELTAMDARTVFGKFRLDPVTGEQVGHESVLTQWQDGHQTLALRA